MPVKLWALRTLSAKTAMLSAMASADTRVTKITIPTRSIPNGVMPTLTSSMLMVAASGTNAKAEFM